MLITLYQNSQILGSQLVESYCLTITLKGKVNDCGQEGFVELIFERLRAQFGMGPREATVRLTFLKREYKTTISEHANEVKKLIQKAYHDLPMHHRQRIIMDVFKNTTKDYLFTKAPEL